MTIRQNALDPDYAPMKGSPVMYHPDPCDYRLIIGTDGEFTLQLGFRWESHDAEGIEWRDSVEDLHDLLHRVIFSD